MAAAASSYSKLASRALPEAQTQIHSSDDLCDELLTHMLDCDLCLDPEQPVCATCVSLQAQIGRYGLPAQSLVFAY